MTSASEVRAVAAVVYDQDSHSEADMAFLDAITAADKRWHDQLRAANIMYGGGSETWHAVKRLATRQCDAELIAALKTLEAHDEIEFLAAAE